MKPLIALSLLFFSSNLWAQSSWEPLKQIVIKTDVMSPNHKEKLQWVKQARELADQCVAAHPADAGCYYYRGQATGLYYDEVIFGYQNGVRSMIKDWEAALKLDPAFDHGGPDRMLGELYSSLPKYFGTKDVRQDLSKALEHLKKSVEIDPNYPTQRFDLAEVFLKIKMKEEADSMLKEAQKLMPEWQNDPYFAGWQDTNKDLKRKLVHR